MAVSWRGRLLWPDFRVLVPRGWGVDGGEYAFARLLSGVY